MGLLYIFPKITVYKSDCVRSIKDLEELLTMNY